MENIQDRIKEAVAKLVAEKKLTAAEKKKKEDIVMGMKKTFKGDKAAMYAIATDKAKKLAEDNIDEARVSQDNVVDYLANTLEYVWSMGKGNNSIDFSDMAQSMYFDMFGGDEMNEEYDFVRSAIESASGDKISHTEEDDYGRTIYWSTKNPNVNYFVGQGGEFEGKIYLYNGETGERYPIGDLKHYGDGQNHSADDDMHESKELDEFIIRRWQHYAGIK